MCLVQIAASLPITSCFNDHMGTHEPILGLSGKFKNLFCYVKLGVD